MLRRSHRLLAVLLAPVLALPVGAAVTGSAAAADPPPGPSAIGDGNLVGDGAYVGSANPDARVDATAGPTREDACAPLPGEASVADVADHRRRLRGGDPEGEGTWRYVVCAETTERARTLARLHPDPAAAKAACAAAVGRCAVVVVWEPEERREQRREQDPPRRLGAFSGWLDFTPDLQTSPTDRDGLIARLPTWVWDRNTADVRGICLPIYGGVCGFAVRLSTSWKTEGERFCGSPGRAYRPGSDDPRSASSCSHTYRTVGTYEITGCKTWLVVVWRLPWYIPIVFPLELCSTNEVGVQEAQVLSGGRPR